VKIANTNIPKILWIYWQQGWDCAPDIVKACLNTWRNRNPNWEIIALDDTNLKNYIDINQIHTLLSNKVVEPEAFSDILRAALLSKHGGVWADSTTFCVVRLDNWLSPYVNNNFFAFSNPGKDRLISSWFIASEPNGYIINKWWSAVFEYWKEHHNRHHYFWFHYLFNDLYSSDKEFKNIWDACPKLSANGPHRFTPYSSLYEEVKADDITAINSRKFPIFKLTHKLDTSLIKSDSLYDYLVRESYRVPNNGYFPNKSSLTMNLEQKFRKAITALPENEKLIAYECYTQSSSDLVDTSFESKENFIIVFQNGSMINFPKPLPLIKYSHIAYGYEQWLGNPPRN